MTINLFKGPHQWLSNFWPCEVTLDGVTYPSVEHAYQAAKTEDLTVRTLIRNAHTAGAAKRLGKRVEIRPDWLEMRIQIMRDLVHQKFQHPELREKLLATGEEELIEGNWWGDTFWGNCKGVGENRLGWILMSERTNIRTKEEKR